jgi:hypothetical protein
MIGYREEVARVEFELLPLVIVEHVRKYILHGQQVSTPACPYGDNKKFQLPFATSSPVLSGFDGEIYNK